MDRRQFFSGIGTVGTLGAVTAGMAFRESGATKARTSGLAQVAGAGSPANPVSSATQNNKALTAAGLALGYLPGSAGIFASPAVERQMQESATGLRWSAWNASLATQTNQSALHSLFKVSSLIDMSIGIVQRGGDVASALAGLDVTAHFALDDAPYFASFMAWQFQAAGKPLLPKWARFYARVPDRVALAINYAIQPSAVATGVSSAGNLYLPLGANAAAESGLATGLYVLAAPSAETGVQPDFGAYMFSGNDRAPIADPTGRALDFDYLTFAIRPVAL